MYELLIKLIVGVSLAQFGIHLARPSDCRSEVCLARLQTVSREVVHIPWKPISVFPEQGARFK